MHGEPQLPTSGRCTSGRPKTCTGANSRAAGGAVPHCQANLGLAHADISLPGRGSAGKQPEKRTLSPLLLAGSWTRQRSLRTWRRCGGWCHRWTPCTWCSGTPAGCGRLARCALRPARNERRSSSAGTQRGTRGGREAAQGQAQLAAL